MFEYDYGKGYLSDDHSLQRMQIYFLNFKQTRDVDSTSIRRLDDIGNVTSQLSKKISKI